MEGGGGLESFLMSTFLIAYQALIFAIVISIVSVYIQWKFFVWVMASRREDETEWYRFKKSLGLIKHERAAKRARLADIIGIDEAKAEVTEVLDFLKNPEKYRAIGSQVPRGVLLVGQPGTGKTMLAQAIANEAGVPFFSVDGGTLDEVFFGIGSLRVRSLFKKARKAATKNPLGTAIIFVDEIDALGNRNRGMLSITGMSAGNMTLNRLLVEMDGLPSTSNIIVISATNYEEMLDTALLRPGRFDRRIYVPMPNMAARKKLLNSYLPKIRTRPPLDLDKLCEMTVNFSPAEIAAVANEAALIAVRRRRLEATQEDLETAVLKISDAAADRRSVGGSMVMARAGDLAVRFKDIIGMEDAKRDTLQIVDLIKNADKIKLSGAHMPRGLLLVGPPGTGKTMLAKAIANEAGVPFYSVSGSDFVEIFVGMGASRVRSVYAQARKHKQAIVFIDEIEALGPARSAMLAGMNQEHSNTLNQFLVELDGFGRSNVITIGATNFDDALDPALLRPGRFDRKIYVPLPDGVTRRQLFQHYLAKVKTRGIFDWEYLVRATTNFSAADIMNIVNEASLIAVRDDRIEATQGDLEQAIEQASSMVTQRLVGTSMVGGRVTDVNVRFDDVIGVDEAKREAREIVEMIKSSERIKSIGARIPKGLLFIGPPGTGKTMLAKAIANEAGIPFYSVSGSDFVEVWVGLGASRIRSVYAQARRHKHAIVFIDEIDALGGRRGGAWNSEHDNTLNQFLVELDGFGKSNVITIGATNFKEKLDTALLRPGRFDRIIPFSLPSLDGRMGILRSYLRKVQQDDTINVQAIGRSTILFSGADLANLVNEAAILALREHRDAVSQKDLIRAIEKVAVGIEHRLTMTPEEKRLIAYHESGHALIAFLVDRKHLVNRVSIIPIAGNSLGHTWSIPTEEFHTTNEQEYKINIMVFLGGYAAEKLVFGYNSDGVSSDFQYIGKLVRHMVLDMGMGGFLFNTNPAVLTENHSWFHNSDALLSEVTKQQVDEAMRRIAEECYQRVDVLLKEHRSKLDLLAEELLKNEVLYHEDIVALLGEEPRLLPPAA